jgi:hypothetical protein
MESIGSFPCSKQPAIGVLGVVVVIIIIIIIINSGLVGLLKNDPLINLHYRLLLALC